MKTSRNVKFRHAARKTARYATLACSVFTVILTLATGSGTAIAAGGNSAADADRALAAAAENRPVVPNFWDPRAVQDRPKDLPEKIQFLASDDFPPFVFRDTDGRLTGFNVDLARAMCQDMGASCALKIVPFDDLVPSLVAGEGDAIIAGLAATTALNGDLTFTQDYMKLPARFMVRAGDRESFDETHLTGQRIAVVAGTRHERFALAFWPDVPLRTYPSPERAREALLSGDADAVFDSGLALATWLGSEDANDCCALAGGPWLEPGHFDEGLSIAVRKTEPELAEALTYALRKTATNGTYRELYLRYFPISFF